MSIRVCRSLSYPKAEHSHETFRKPKWRKMNKQLSLTYVFISFVIETITCSVTPSVTPLRALLGFSDTLGHILLMDAQNKFG